jgi:diguanylate cyclase (GGDEF)-like protein
VFETLRANLFAKTHPELRHYRARMAWAILNVYYLLLALWLLITVILFAICPTFQKFDLTFSLISIGALASLGVIVRWALRQDLVSMAGHVIAILVYLFLVACLWFYPNDIFLISAGFVLPIIATGVIIGGNTSFFYAGAASLTVILGWLRTRALAGAVPHLYELASGSIFILSQVVAHQSLAAMFFSMSRYNQQTFERLRQQAEQLTHQALTDPLTGLANRRHLIEQLRREFTRARRYQRPLSLIYLDLDGFKSINDRFGHLFGDEILKKAALAMRAVLRSADQLARIGGDEFAVLLPETTLEGSRNVTRKLRKALNSFSQHLGPMIPVLTFCAGVAQLREEDESIDALLARADEAQYRAKDAGTGETRTQLDFDQLPLFEQSQSTE